VSIGTSSLPHAGPTVSYHSHEHSAGTLAAGSVSGVWTSQIGRRVEAALHKGRTPAAARRFRAGLAGRRR